MEALFAALEASAFAATMRSSLFLYPLANVVHILAALAFFAAVAAMDVKLLLAASFGGARAFIARVRPLASIALLVQAGSGFLLFAPEATHIWHNPVFRVKLVLVAVALANVLLLEALVRHRGDETARMGSARGSAAASLGLWLAIAAAGRLIAYF
jgi:uncharacterized membrane protein